MEWDKSIEYDPWCVSCDVDTIDMDCNSYVAKPFDEVQKKVNDLLDGRILIGHAVHNDLKALILSKFLCLEY